VRLGPNKIHIKHKATLALLPDLIRKLHPARFPVQQAPEDQHKDAANPIRLKLKEGATKILHRIMPEPTQPQTGMVAHRLLPTPLQPQPVTKLPTDQSHPNQPLLEHLRCHRQAD